MCDFCENKKRIDTTDSFSSLELKIKGDELTIGYDAYSTDSSFGTEVKIKYCMFCGTKLKKTE